MKNPNAFQVTINIPVVLLNSIPLISFEPVPFNKTSIQLLLCHSTKLMIGTLCPISTLERHLIKLEHTYIRCSLHCDRWIVKEQGRKQTYSYTGSPRHWLRDVTYHGLDTNENLRCLIEKWFSRHLWVKTNLKCPINSPTYISSLEKAERKQSLGHRSTTLSISKLFHRF